ncbi:unnamed protein product, partial [Dicrocoelium dendriticum]
MEGNISDALTAKLEEFNYLTPEQHGFRRNRSCTTNLPLARSSWNEAVDAGTGVDVVFLDFSKAFDRFNLSILLFELQTVDIGDPLLGWIRSFLLHQRLEVRVRESLSAPIRFECGVPKGL